jgi:Flp pilus assembly CpaF family ATPase
LSSILEKSGTVAVDGLPAQRALGRILAFEDDDPRFPPMQETWTAFAAEMGEAVREVLDGGRSPAEIAYAVGVIVHNYFRARGVTLTSYELRALATELVGPGRAGAIAAPAPAPEAPVPVAAEAEKAEKNGAGGLVSFGAADTGPATAWAGEDVVAPRPVVPDAVFEPPLSRLVSLIDREAASFDRLLAKVVEIAGPRLAGAPDALAGVPDTKLDRARALESIDAAIDEMLRGQAGALPADLRERLALGALSELCGLGLIDRLWADRSVRAVFVDGPETVHVDRNGVREPAPEIFRSPAHLLEIARRLARPATAGVVEFQLRDGGAGLVIFPPAAPSGPVLAIRRGAPGQATFERLIASDMLDARIAGFLRMAARARLRVLVLGPDGSGKTALLAAIARDAALQRVATLARHREFGWPSDTKIELVAGEAGSPSYAELMAAAARLQPDLLILDSVRIEDVSSLAERLMRGARGIVAAVGTDVAAAALARSADLVVRLGRSRDGFFRAVSLEDATGAALVIHDGGQFVRRTVQPAFAATVREAGYGEALARILRQ